jgi:hypothetical protein
MFSKEDCTFVVSSKVVEAPTEMVLVATANISYSASYVSRINRHLKIRFYTFRILTAQQCGIDTENNKEEIH